MVRVALAELQTARPGGNCDVSVQRDSDWPITLFLSNTSLRALHSLSSALLRCLKQVDTTWLQFSQQSCARARVSPPSLFLPGSSCLRLNWCDHDLPVPDCVCARFPVRFVLYLPISFMYQTNPCRLNPTLGNVLRISILRAAEEADRAAWLLWHSQSSVYSAGFLHQRVVALA